MLRITKKAQSISINTIIIAAIALAVLVVLFLIFTGRLSIFSKGLEGTVTCENACKSVGKSYRIGDDLKQSDCDVQGRSYIGGSYSDAKSGCCCSST